MTFHYQEAEQEGPEANSGEGHDTCRCGICSDDYSTRMSATFPIPGVASVFQEGCE